MAKTKLCEICMAGHNGKKCSGGGCKCNLCIKTKVFQIEVHEELNLVIDVRAKTAEEARKKIEKKYLKGDIVLTADNSSCDSQINIL